jgi:sugar phosphate isomerase/epimerase
LVESRDHEEIGVAHSHLSVQLYTVREAMEQDLKGTLKRLAEIGFTQVEPYNFTAFAGLGDALNDHGLTAPTAHMRFIGTDYHPVFQRAHELGILTVIDPRIDEKRWQTRKDIAGVADDLNAAARVATEYGITVGYHNHAFELETLIDGIPALEHFAGDLDDSVRLELDTYWAAVGGQDPVALLGRLGEKVFALHLKDGPVTREAKDQLALGKGSLPITEIVAAAPSALRVIELDDCRDDRFQAVADSYSYLVAQNLA